MITFDTQTQAADNRNRLLATLNLCLMALEMPRLYSDQARTAIEELRREQHVHNHDDGSRVVGHESPATALLIGGYTNG